MFLRFKKIIFTGINRILQIIYPLRIAGTEESINYIIKNKCSLSRFGEGEISLLARKQDLKFQKYNQVLADRMREILISKNKNIAIAIPLGIKDRDTLNKRAAEFWYADTAYSMIDWVRYTLFGKRYLDSLMTRCYIDLKDQSRTKKLYDLWKIVWDNRKVLIIEGKESRIGVGNDLFSNCKEIKRILCPSVNAFDHYKEIFNYARKQDNDYLVLVALGPTASVLAYDLSQLGFQTLDVGHIDIEYEWYKMGAKEPIRVPGKFTNEVKDGDIVEKNEEKDYLDQVMEIIGE